MGRTTTEAIDYLNRVIDEASKSYGGSFRDGCLAIEAALKILDAAGDHVLSFTLIVRPEGVAIEAVTLGDRPEAFHLEGVWALLYSLCMPRNSPFFKEPLRISSVVVTHGKDPCVSYDRGHDNGLPMALDRPFDGEKFDPLGPEAKDLKKVPRQ